MLTGTTKSIQVVSQSSNQLTWFDLPLMNFLLLFWAKNKSERVFWWALNACVVCVWNSNWQIMGCTKDVHFWDESSQILANIRGHFSSKLKLTTKKRSSAPKCRIIPSILLILVLAGIRWNFKFFVSKNSWILPPKIVKIQNRFWHFLSNW